MRAKRISENFSGIFEHVPLTFEPEIFSDVFASKNNKTLAETFAHWKYSKLSSLLASEYRPNFELPLGTLLLSLKEAGDANYKKFLNKNGDLTYCRFKLAGPEFAKQRGVYCYFLDDHIVYIGRCRDSMKRRIDQGYGKIHPKNCYIDGQSTNCHLNARITAVRHRISLWLCIMDSDQEIVQVERQLITELRPKWNVQL